MTPQQQQQQTDKAAVQRFNDLVAAKMATGMGKTDAVRAIAKAHPDVHKAFLLAHKLEMNGRSWEVYVSDPGNTPEAELRTEIYYPVK